MTELAQAVVNGLQMGFLYALVAVGLTIIWGLMEMINFAHGEFLMLGMFGAWWLSDSLGLDPLLAIVPIALVMYGFGVLVYRHLMRRVQGGDPFTQIFATIGLLFLLQNAVVAGFTSDFRFVNDSLLARLSGTKLSLLGVTFGVPLLLAAGLALLLFLALYLLIERTEFGLALQATSEDRDAARLVGIRPQRMFAVAWGLGAALVAIAGAILVNFFAVYPQVGLQFTVLAYAIVALGGFGSVLGTLFAALLVGVIQSVTVVYLPPAFKDAFVFASYLLIGLFRPAGPVRALLEWGGSPWSSGLWRRSSIRFRFSSRARPTTRRSGSWCSSTRCSASAGTSSGGGRGSSTSGRRCSSASAPTPRRLLYVKLGVDAWLGLLAGVVVAAGMCAVLTYPLTRLRGHYFAIATVAIWMIAQPIGATWEYIGGSQGLFIPMKPRAGVVGLGAVAAVLGADQGHGLLLRGAGALRHHAGAHGGGRALQARLTTSARFATIRRAPRASASTAGSTR